MDWMISIYQEDLKQYSDEEIFQELTESRNMGAVEVFTSLHMPETDWESQLQAFMRLAGLTEKVGMALCADIGGIAVQKILEQERAWRFIRQLSAFSLRLDYGFDSQQIQKLVEKLQIAGVVLNASILSQREAERLVKTIREINGQIRISGCHNFYPRKETGLTYEFCRNQTKIFRDLGLSVTVCVSSLHKPRGPLFHGLPTIERQRTMDMEKKLTELLTGEYGDCFMIGDSFPSVEEKELIRRILLEQRHILRVIPERNITAQEREIIFDRPHKLRYDSGEFSWRSQSSREMSEIAASVNPGNTVERNAYAVTIDNQRYLRYSGELQIMKMDAPADEKVNVVGRIPEGEQWKLSYLETGIQFVMKEAEGEENIDDGDTSLAGR